MRIVGTFAAGGAADVLARTVAEDLSAAFRQQFFVETRAGAGGTIGLMSVTHAEPDGYNFVITSLSLLAITPVVNPNIGYDPLRDLTHVAYLAGTPVVLTVNPASGVKTLQDFLTFARKSAKPLTYSSSGIGSYGQLVAEAFAHEAGIKIELVPYKGASQGLADLAGGHITFAAQTLSSASGLIRGGTLTPLAHTAPERVPDYTDIPTFKELGYPDVTGTNWFALAAPAGTPKAIVDKVNQAVVRAMAKPEAQRRLRDEALLAQAMTPDEFRTFIEAERARLAPVIKRLGLGG